MSTRQRKIRRYSAFNSSTRHDSSFRLCKVEDFSQHRAPIHLCAVDDFSKAMKIVVNATSEVRQDMQCVS
eukprot:6181942-Pleurochrysis_carterae.AAC.1